MKACLFFRLKRQLFCRAIPRECACGAAIFAPYDTCKRAWENYCKRRIYRKYCVPVKPENYELKVSTL